MIEIAQAELIVVAASQLQTFAAAALQAVGARRDDAQYMANQIVEADLAGHESHGLRRLREYIDRAQAGVAQPAATSTIELDRGSLVRLNGNRGYGHIVVRDATALAVERSRVHGIAAVAVRGCEYAGRFSSFCEEAAESGVTTLFFVNDSGACQDVAPPGGLQARLSTNPIAIGVPRASAPHLVLDIATSTVAMGKLSESKDRGEDIPPDWMTPAGILQPFGGMKGFGLALVAEALAGALTCAGTVSARPIHEDHQGVLIIALQVEDLRPINEFTSEVDAFLTYVKDTPTAPGWGPITVPGERSAQTATRRQREGVPVRRHTWQAIEALAAELRLGLPEVITATLQQKRRDD